ncbi:hypothetical protein Tco_1537933, partial [Tanacetum coccineum]
MTPAMVAPEREEIDTVRRLQCVATRLGYFSEDVDEEKEMDAPIGFQSQPTITEGRVMQGVPLLLATHLRETGRRRTLSPREALVVNG